MVVQLSKSSNKPTQRQTTSWDALQYAFWEFIRWFGVLKTLYDLYRFSKFIISKLRKLFAFSILYIPTRWLHAHTHIQWVLDDTFPHFPRGDMVGLFSWDMMQQPKHDTYAMGTINVPINLLQDILAVPENSSTFSAFFQEREVVALYSCSFWR